MQQGASVASPASGAEVLQGGLRRAVAAGAWLRDRLHGEADRWFLWLPVLLGVGIVLYFASPSQPPDWAVAVAALLALLLVAAAYGAAGSGDLRRAALLGTAAMAAGFAVAGNRTGQVAAPVVARPGTWTVTGRIVEAAPAIRGYRLVLDRLTLEGRGEGPPPLRVRVTVRSGGEGLGAGDVVRLRARLEPPAPPVMPGGFDFARHAWFERLGGIGYSFGAPQLLERAEPTGLELGVARLREAVTRRIVAAVPGEGGAVAAALVTGLRAGISDDTWRAMQVSGLAHLLSISGLHMALVAGTLFLAVRFAAALVPPLVHRLPAKKVAAVAAMAGSIGYLLLSGASIPTQRSFVMVEVGLLAVLVDRNPLSMRVLAWAALVVLLLRPESVVGVSFQLSFAAVLALIATYETGFGLPRADRAAGLGRRAWVYALGVVATSAIASTATTPLTAVHFQTMATYGVLANLVAVPVTTVLVMPAGLLSLALMPLGLEAPALAVMASGVTAVLATARAVAGLPGASIAVTAWPPSVLVAFGAGGLWLALWRTRWRWAGLAPMGLAAALAWLHTPPDLLVDRRLDMALWRHESGEVRLAAWRRDGWVTRDWLKGMGVDDAGHWPAAGADPSGAVACDPHGCVVTAAGRRVALARTAAALAADCRLADLVVARAGPERCPGPTPLVGPGALWASGGLAIWLLEDGVVVRTVAEGRGAWPWVR